MIIGSKGYLIASFLLFLLDFYQTDIKELGMFGYLYLNKPSLTNLIIRYNFAVALVVVMLKALASLVCDHLDDDDDYKLHKVMRIRAIGVLIVTVCYLPQFDSLWFLVLVAQFGHYLCHEYLALQAQRLFKWHSPLLSDYLRVLAAYMLLMFLDFEVLYRSDLRGSGMESRILWEVMLLFTSSLWPFLGLVVASWQAFTHNEFKLLRSNWQKNVWRAHALFSLGVIIASNLLMKPSKTKSDVNKLIGVQVLQAMWMVWRVYDSYQRDEQLKQKIKQIEETYEDEMMGERDKLCVVCFRDMERGRRLACRHILHEDCLKMWLERTGRESCPKCKQSIYTKKVPKKIVAITPTQESIVHEIQPLLTVTRQAAQPINRTARGRQLQQTTETANNGGYFTGSATQITFEAQPVIDQQVVPPPPSTNDNGQGIRNIKIGSLPFGLPTEAVYRRTKEHFELRNAYLAKLAAAE